MLCTQKRLCFFCEICLASQMKCSEKLLYPQSCLGASTMWNGSSYNSSLQLTLRDWIQEKLTTIKSCVLKSITHQAKSNFKVGLTKSFEVSTWTVSRASHPYRKIPVPLSRCSVLLNTPLLFKQWILTKEHTSKDWKAAGRLILLFKIVHYASWITC